MFTLVCAQGAGWRWRWGVAVVADVSYERVPSYFAYSSPRAFLG